MIGFSTLSQECNSICERQHVDNVRLLTGARSHGTRVSIVAVKRATHPQSDLTTILDANRLVLSACRSVRDLCASRFVQFDLACARTINFFFMFRLHTDRPLTAPPLLSSHFLIKCKSRLLG